MDDYYKVDNFYPQNYASPTGHVVLSPTRLFVGDRNRFMVLGFDDTASDPTIRIRSFG